MPSERGVVTRIEGRNAWVTTSRSSACEGCASRGACHASQNEDEMEVRAVNVAGAEVGDRVVVSLQAASYLKASFLLYVFPVLAMIAGAVLGQESASWVRIDSGVSSVVFGFLFFFLAIVLIRYRSNRMARNEAYQPKISKII
jgi:sigma-E factor negative regulatory protein RseC